MKPKKHVFPVSQKMAYLPQVSLAAIAMKLQRKYAKPKPPRQMVDYGDGRKVWEHNYAHPDYEATLKTWENFIQTEAGLLALQRVTDITLAEEQQAEVDAWKAENPALWDETDRDVDLWFEEIAIVHEDDYTSLVLFVRHGEPAAEVVEPLLDGFRS